MTPGRIPLKSANIQHDIQRAFQMRERQIFERGNRQIYAIVGGNPEMGVVCETWFGEYETSAEFRSVLTHVLELVRRERLRYWLIDLRFKVPDFRRDLKWIESSLLPAAIAAGVERGAAVLPETAAVRDGQDLSETLFNLLGKAGGGRMRGFKDIDLAKRWLLEGELPPAA